MPAQPLRKYWTGLRTFQGELRHELHASTRYRGPGWEIRFIPYEREYPGLPKQRRKKLNRLTGKGHELFILARSLTTATYVASLLFAARAILEGTPVEHMLLGWEPYPAIPVDEGELQSLPPQQRHFLTEKRKQHPFYMEAGGFFDVAHVACKLARQRRLQNAAFKYLLSGYLIRTHHMELRPGAREAKEFRSVSPMDWVWFSHSVFAAYGVIEELRLTPKASQTQPSLLPNGEWNPPVRANLEQRLAKIGIKPTDTFYWHARGHPTRLETRAATRFTKRYPTQWTQGDVRDAQILYIDAINISNFLRSNVSAHVGDVSSLTALDAANVQHLARMLLLKAIGFHFWRGKGGKR